MTLLTGLSKDIFQTYVPEKWSSNVHNLPRMRAKDTILALCDQAAQPLAEALTGLSRAASDEIPNIMNQKKVDAQWVYWFRDATARTSLASFLEKTKLDEATIFNIAPQDKHITLAIVVRQEGLWVGVRLAHGAVVDRKNVASKFEKTWEREQFTALLQACGDSYQVGFEQALMPTAAVTHETYEAWQQALIQDTHPWQIGVLVAASEIVEKSREEITEHLQTSLRTLIPLYRFCSWTRENDQIEANKQLQDEKQLKRKNLTGLSSGDKVRFVSGLFSGKIGIVQETDTKSQVKVLVGKMSVVVAHNEITPAP